MELPVVALPVSLARRGYPTPSCCARHGSPATLTRPVRIFKRPPQWVIAVGGVVIAFVVMLFSEKMLSPAWPFCDECRQERTFRLTVGGVLCGAAPLPYLAVLVTAPIADAAASGLLPIVLSGVASAALLLVGLGFLAAAGWQTLCGAVVSRDGAWVHVSNAHPTFAEQIGEH